ncbi:GNAT family N-acetyltransferase [Alteromonas sp. CYL-A6]|uniref:GNAT family N-acetyltransferase n=1 Tax=Alteromonas nitratireducens TaxID=3390813 RepID=UPI0034B4052B
MTIDKAIAPLFPDEEMLDLLKSCLLPVSDISLSERILFYGCHEHGSLCALIGLELHGNVAMLRSLAVTFGARKRGLGRSLVIFAEHQAMKRGIETLFLLTETANNLFIRLGYTYCDRTYAPKSVRDTPQFSVLCSSSSHFMSKQLLKK